MKYIIRRIREAIEKIEYNWYLRKLSADMLVVGADVDISTMRIKKTVRIYPGSNLHIGSNLCMADNCVIDANDSYGIFIGNNLLSAQDVYIRSGNHDYSFSELPFQNRGHCAKKLQFNDNLFSVVIEDNVWIGRGASILSGAWIGKGSVIGAGAVVKERIPDYSIVVGNPSVIVSNRQKIESFDERSDIGIFG